MYVTDNQRLSVHIGENGKPFTGPVLTQAWTRLGLAKV